MRLVQFVTAVGISLAAVTVAYFLGLDSASSDSDRAVIRASEIQIVDANGVVRARLGADLPDAVVDGKVVDRGGRAAGVLLYDSDGQERSGYVTMEPGKHVMLTLDSQRRQVGLLAAGPDGGATIRLWGSDDAIEMRSDQGGARLTAVKGGEVAFQAPEADMPEAACRSYNQALETMARTEVMAACTERFLRELCNACVNSD